MSSPCNDPPQSLSDDRCAKAPSPDGQPVRPSFELLEMIGNELNELNEMVDKQFERFDPVLRPADPSETAKADCGGPPESQLCVLLREVLGRASAIRGRLEEFCQRCHV